MASADGVPALAVRGLTAGYGETTIVRDADLTSPYPYLWSLPARVRDADLRSLVGLLRSPDRPEWVLVAERSLDVWRLDFSTAQGELDREYDEVTRAGKFTVYRRADA